MESLQKEFSENERKYLNTEIYFEHFQVIVPEACLRKIEGSPKVCDWNL